MRPLTRSTAIAELFLAGIFWGFGFIGTVWCLKSLTPSAIIFYRFFIAFAAGILVLAIQKRSLSGLINQLVGEAKLSFWPGVYLWLTLIFQTWGLQYTTATNSTFITVLYVVTVPLMNSMIGKEIIGWIHWLCVVIALGGTALIVNLQNLSTLNFGDLLTLVCSIFAAIHIIAVGIQTLKTKSDFAFNTMQSFWMSIFSLLLFPFTTGWNLLALDEKGWIGLIALGFGSSLLAFFLQVRAQKIISPSVVSLMFLLESPMSCVFAYLLLNETLNGLQWLGAGFIMLACIAISLNELRKEAVKNINPPIKL